MRQQSDPKFTEAAANRIDELAAEFNKHLSDESVSVAKAERGPDKVEVVFSDVSKANRRLRAGPARRWRRAVSAAASALIGLGIFGITVSVQGHLAKSPRWVVPGYFVAVLLVGIVCLIGGVLCHLARDEG